ncbi:MAG: fimbrial biogenesis chaperone [Aeromonas hydrophila]
MKKSLFYFVLFVSVFNSTSLYANIIINGTRFIYVENEKEITVKLTNKSNNAVLIQSWIDNGDPDEHADNIRTPFVITPPITKINKGLSQTLRISKSSSEHLENIEKVFYLNVLEIAAQNANEQNKDRNKLQLAFRSRMKLFLRPVALKNGSEEAFSSLSWMCSKNSCKVKNNSLYHVSLVSISFNNSSDKIAADLLFPLSTMDFNVPKAQYTSIKSVTYTYINDWGAIKRKTVKL